MSATEQPYRPAQINFLREVKVDSPVHRLWAGTKILSVAGLSVTLSYFPSWGCLGVAAALLLVAVLSARIPSGAWPRPPLWFWVTVVVAGVVTSISGGSPYVDLLGLHLGLGGLDVYVRFVGVGILLILAAAVLGWTTPLGEIAPAVATLLRPLRLVRVPVDEAAAAVALTVRSLPLLVGEMRSLVAARRLRPPPAHSETSQIGRWMEELIDFMVTAMAVSVRRAGELAEAITARGGIGLVAARPARPGRRDLLALVLVAGVCYAGAAIPG